MEGRQDGERTSEGMKGEKAGRDELKCLGRSGERKRGRRDERKGLGDCGL